jgi:hypothetical protein
MKLPRTLVLSSILLLIVFYIGCKTSSRNEVANVQSPDDRVEAALYETNGGATTSFGYEIELRQKSQKKGIEIAQLDGAVRNENAYGVNLRWNGNEELDVEYFKTKWHSKFPSTASVAGRNIHVVVRDGVIDPSAPSGGMLYNLNPK